MNSKQMQEWKEESIKQAYERFEGESLAQCAEYVTLNPYLCRLEDLWKL